VLRLLGNCTVIELLHCVGTVVVLEQVLLRVTTAARLTHCQPSSIHLTHCSRTTTSSKRSTASITTGVLKVGFVFSTSNFQTLCLIHPEAVNRCLDPKRFFWVGGGTDLVNSELISNLPYNVNGKWSLLHILLRCPCLDSIVNVVFKACCMTIVVKYWALGICPNYRRMRGGGGAFLRKTTTSNSMHFLQ
jgi:hypothetical protein